MPVMKNRKGIRNEMKKKEKWRGGIYRSLGNGKNREKIRKRDTNEEKQREKKRLMI